MVSPDPSILTLQDIHLRNFKNCPKKRFLGYRKQITAKEIDKQFTWLSYGQVEQRARNIGSGIVNLGLAPARSEYKNYNLNFIAIYSKNTIDWFVIDIASVLYNITTVPIYDTLGEEATAHMFAETNLTTCFCSTDHIKGMVSAFREKKLASLEQLVIMDEHNLTKDHEELLKGIKYHTLSSIEANGKENPQQYRQVKPEDIYSFSYTSGTTGQAKGAMISHANIVAGLAGANARILIKTFRYLSYLPMAHVYERFCSNFIVLK